MSLNQLRINIKFLRKRIGLTQTNVSEIIGVKQNLFQTWEVGRSLPQKYALLSLSQLFGITINDLVTEDMTKVEMYNKEWYAVTSKIKA